MPSLTPTQCLLHRRLLGRRRLCCLELEENRSSDLRAAIGFRVSDLRVSGSFGLRVSDLGFRVSGLGTLGEPFQ